MKDLQASPSPLHHSCLTALCHRGHHQTVPKLPHPFSRQPSRLHGAFTPSPQPCPAVTFPCLPTQHLTHPQQDQQPPVPHQKRQQRKGIPAEAAMMGASNIPAVSATLLGTFPPVQSKAEEVHLGFSCVTMSSDRKSVV